jgi:hypothetical protein
LLHMSLPLLYSYSATLIQYTSEKEMFAKAYNVADAGRMTFLFKADLDPAAPVEEGVICMRNLVAIMKY